MDSAKAIESKIEQPITIDDVQRLLDIGRILLSVLTEEELSTIQANLFCPKKTCEIGNAGDS